MKLLENILLATDFSKSTENIVRKAIGLAKIFQAKITLIHVLPDNITDKKAKLLLNEAAMNQLEIINKSINSEGVLTNNSILEYGSPFDRIVVTANTINTNLLLIGAGEKLENDIFQLGITAEKIIRRSNKPVWVIKRDRSLDIKKILCPVDFSRESKQALKNAIIMARRFNAELNILSVNQLVYSGPLSLKMDWHEQNVSKRLEHTKEFDLFLKKFNLVDMNWKKEIRDGDPDKEILATIKSQKTDLVIMGTTGKSGLSRMIIGSVTEKVIREVPCSFITMKSEDIMDLKLETRIRDIESHYGIARQLAKDGFYEESINEFKTCLSINDMHIASLNGIANVYEKLNEHDNAEKYRSIVKEILNRIWDRKIEAEVRKYYKS